MTVETLEDIGELAQQLRVDSIRCSTAAGSGHPTSSMSAADVMAVLQARYLRYDWEQPDNPANDHLIFSKGHASPLLYSMFKAAGVVSDEELIDRTGGSAHGWRATRPRCCRGWTSPPGRSARGCPTGSGWPWPAGISMNCPTGCGCCAATARWRKGRCGRRSTRRPTTGWTT